LFDIKTKVIKSLYIKGLIVYNLIIQLLNNQ
jgi:hypothetical protein